MNRWWLKEYAGKFHAGKGWTFLTGRKENLDWALYELGQYVEAKESHKTVIIVGNEATGLWKKALGSHRRPSRSQYSHADEGAAWLYCETTEVSGPL